MSVKEIAIVIVLFVAFILMFFQTIRVNPNKKPKVWTLSERILVIVCGIVLTALAWFHAPEGSLIPKISITAFAILYIYRALNGWLFGSKERKLTASSQSPD
jgi:hypothetical protein